MKKYPKNLADLQILTRTVEHLYEMSESYQARADEYKERLKDADSDSWIMEEIQEMESQRDACIRLAEKLAK